MIPEGLVTYTLNDIERMARDLLRRRPDIEFAPPIKLERLIENTPDLSLEITNILPYAPVEGYVCKDAAMSRRMSVIVDMSIFSGPWSAYNAVLGEEFAHIQLHPSLLLFVNSVEDFVELQNDPQWPRFERDARLYSASIRMPPTLVTREAEVAYKKIVDEHGFGDCIKIEKLVRNELAAKFLVSPDDMQRRIMNWPCGSIRERLTNSVQSASLELVPSNWSVKVMPPVVQKPLFDVE